MDEKVAGNERTVEDIDKMLAGANTQAAASVAAPIVGKPTVTLLNMSKSPINILDNKKVLTGYTLLPGIVTPDIPADAWEEAKTLPAIKGMLDEETIIVSDRFGRNIEREALTKKVTDPEMPEDLKGETQSMGQRSTISKPDAKEVSGITLTEKEK